VKNLFSELKNIVYECGKELLKWKKTGYDIRDKNGPDDIVTELDLRTQDLLMEKLLKKFGDIEVLAEEKDLDRRPQVSEYWVIDPIDGTVNFSRGMAEYCISVAYVRGDEPEIGIVYVPQMDMMFACHRGYGAFLNDEKIMPCWSKNLSKSIITMGNIKGTTYKYFELLEHQVMRIRIMGSAAIQTAYTASGFADAFISLKANAWDIAAGYLLLKESGGEVVRFDGSKAGIYDQKALYANPYITGDLIKILKGWEK